MEKQKTRKYPDYFVNEDRFSIECGAGFSPHSSDGVSPRTGIGEKMYTKKQRMKNLEMGRKALGKYGRRISGIYLKNQAVRDVNNYVKYQIKTFGYTPTEAKKKARMHFGI